MNRITHNGMLVDLSFYQKVNPVNYRGIMLLEVTIIAIIIHKTPN